MTTPTAIAFMVVHWCVVTFSLLFEETQFFRKSYTFDLPEPTVFNWLLCLNMPSFMIVELLVHPILSLFGKSLITEGLGMLVLVCCITIQWLLIGFLANTVINVLKAKEIKIPLE